MALARFLHSLPAGAEHLTPPPRFTYPFYYQAHPLAVAAARDLQRHLAEQQDWQHDFGLPLRAGQTGSGGKMFGVLVVRAPSGSLCYLAAYSGKLAGRNDLPGFVPPVFDLLDPEGFFRAGEQEVHAVTLQIQAFEQSEDFVAAQQAYREATERERDEVAAERHKVKSGKEHRAMLREQITLEAPPNLDWRLQELKAESIADSYQLKDLRKALNAQKHQKEKILDEYLSELRRLHDHRAALSAALQRRIFRQYTFLNGRKESQSLDAIFAPTTVGVPPAGAGECAAPKLLQFAYQHDLQPLTMAEFWWGEPPPSAIRQHGQFYPACRGKCGPILGHMLTGLETDPNPLLDVPSDEPTLNILYEDDVLLVVNKPSGVLSVPGRHVDGSVTTCVRARYPDAEGPMVAHRLDMSTSGVMVFTKTLAAHRAVQRQFGKRSVKKRYVALLDGQLTAMKGTIDLPLRGDLNDRPRQIVCHRNGKPAQSHYEAITERDGRTLLYFYPVTGRTHQLRVHAAHPEGLGVPIVGDDLYGSAADRLYLHAEELTLRHPVTKAVVSFTAPHPFGSREI